MDEHEFSIFSDDERERERIVSAFEQALAEGDSSRIGDLVPIDAELRRRVLIELLHIDLEHGIKNGQPKRVEDYAAWLTELDKQQLVELIAAEFRLRRSVESSVSPNEYVDRFPDCQPALSEELSALLLEDPASMPDATASNSSADTDAGIEAAHNMEAGSRFADYMILETIARGGMGIVYKAKQGTPQRTVALKLIRSGEFADGEEIGRFRIEAEAAANLYHPHIVPVYEVGKYKGKDFFSMGYVAGHSLVEKIAAGPLPPRDAGQLLRTVAGAVQYAHDNGIVHRDLKPGNILIDADDQPHVTDFGLAKQIKADSGLTMTGQVVGTPSYMAPEQALGKTDEINTRSDVYSLGAVLYCALTGRPPFQAASMYETIQQVVNDDPVPPRQLNSAIDKDLETICQKALEKSPSERYESCDAFRKDLERWLENRPIKARPVSAWERGWRWCRRNPVVAVLATSVCFLMLAATTGAIAAATIVAARNEALQTQWQRAEDNAALAEKRAVQASDEANRARAAEAESEKERRRAEENLRSAREAVDSFFTKVSESQLLNVPDMEPLREDLLKNAKDYYLTFLSQNKDDPEMRAELAAAEFRIAQTAFGGDVPSALEAVEHVRNGLDIVKELVQSNKVGVLDSLRNGVYKGRMRFAPGSGGTRLPKAAAWLILPLADDMCRLWARMVELDPSAGLRNDWAGLCNIRGLLQDSAGRDDEAMESYQQAIQIWSELLEPEPEDWKKLSDKACNYLSDKAIAYSNIAEIHRSREDFKTTLEFERNALELQKRLAVAKPQPFFLLDFAMTQREVAQLHELLGQPNQALEHYRASKETFETLLSQSNPQKELEKIRVSIAELEKQLSHTGPGFN